MLLYVLLAIYAFFFGINFIGILSDSCFWKDLREYTFVTLLVFPFILIFGPFLIPGYIVHYIRNIGERKRYKKSLKEMSECIKEADANNE